MEYLLLLISFAVILTGAKDDRMCGSQSVLIRSIRVRKASVVYSPLSLPAMLVRIKGAISNCYLLLG